MMLIYIVTSYYARGRPLRSSFRVVSASTGKQIKVSMKRKRRIFERLSGNLLCTVVRIERTRRNWLARDLTVQALVLRLVTKSMIWSINRSIQEVEGVNRLGPQIIRSMSMMGRWVGPTWSGLFWRDLLYSRKRRQKAWIDPFIDGCSSQLLKTINGPHTPRLTIRGEGSTSGLEFAVSEVKFSVTCGGRQHQINWEVPQSERLNFTCIYVLQLMCSQSDRNPTFYFQFENNLKYI